MMKRIDDMARWTEAALDTPFRPTAPPTRNEYTPGICVKSREREETAPHLPKLFGRVVEFDTEKNYALVRSYGSRFDSNGADPRLAGTIWEGPISDCLKMWEID